MPDFDVQMTITVKNVATQQDAVNKVRQMIERGGVSKGRVSFYPIPENEVESEPR
jgi:predicted O-linked N-acetylglucosamine transferase (SPINDLY family)